MTPENQGTTPENKSDNSAVEIDSGGDFENELLGERQEEACSMEDGCQSCQ